MRITALAMAATMILAGSAYASSAPEAPKEDNHCVGSGPQAPRDVDSLIGTNQVLFEMAPDFADMNLCNVHFHRNAEHKAAAYSTFVKDGDHSGWACQEPAAGRIGKEHVDYKGCQGIAEGDTIEVHWVYTTCDTETKGVKPLGGGLSACMTSTCANPELHVVAQVFVLEKGGKLKFTDTKPPAYSDASVMYTGSTTGTSYSNSHCSPYSVTWNVRTNCQTLDIDDFSTWCAKNKYNDNHAHGVRALVTSESLLSPIKK